MRTEVWVAAGLLALVVLLRGVGLGWLLLTVAGAVAIAASGRIAAVLPAALGRLAARSASRGSGRAPDEAVGGAEPAGADGAPRGTPPPWIPAAARVAAVVFGIHVVLAAVLWAPPWRHTWPNAWLPAAAHVLPARTQPAALLAAAAHAPAATAVGDYQTLVAERPTAHDLTLLGQAQVAAGQAGGPPVALDTALYLGGSGPSLYAALGQWYMRANGGAVGGLQAWTYLALAARLRPKDTAYANAAKQALAAANQGLRLGPWTQ